MELAEPRMMINRIRARADFFIGHKKPGKGCALPG
jgi:hypothetical protein